MIPISAIVEEPARGAWVADTVTTDKPTGVFELGDVTWTGTPAAPGPVLDGSRWRARIVGGAGKLATVLRPQNYVRAVNWNTIAADIIRAAGERAGTLAVPGAASYYERSDGTAGEALLELCEASGGTWWVGRDGLVNFASSRPASPAEIDEKDLPRLGLDVDGTVIFNVTKSANDVSPGQSLDGHVIAALRWVLEPHSLQVECATYVVTFASQAPSFYLRMYEAKVDKQNGDGSVDVIANGQFRLSSVRLLSGLPGTTITVKPGELVAVGFFGGNRSKPYALCMQQLDSGGNPIALNADTVTMLLPPFALTATALIAGVPTAITGVMTALTGQTLGTITGPSSERTKSK